MNRTKLNNEKQHFLRNETEILLRVLENAVSSFSS